jgi:hypothetical protein
MYTLPTGQIVNSLKILSVAQLERRKDREQPGLSSSIPVAPAPPAQHDETEQTAETEHRRSFS